MPRCPDKKHNYVYLITEISTDKKYIGARSTNLNPVDELGIKYFSSSTDSSFIKQQKDFPTNYKYEIISSHISREESIAEEIKLHNKHDVSNNPNFFNKAKQSSTGFDTTGKVVVRGAGGNTYIVNVNDPKYLSGELKHHSINKFTAKDKNDNYFSISKDDPRYLSGELVHVVKNKAVVLDKFGVSQHVNKDDPRLLTGELVPFNRGKVTVRDSNNNLFKVSVDDPRYLSGELVHNCKGLIKFRLPHHQKWRNIKKCSVDGIVYDSMKAAAEALGISKPTLSKRVKSSDPKYNNYFILEKSPPADRTE